MTNSKDNSLKTKLQNGFENLAKKTGEFFTNIKESIKFNQEKIKIKFKKIQLQWLINQTDKWKKHPKTLAIKKILEKEFNKIQSDTKEIKGDTEQIKSTTTQILLNSEQILIILDNLDYKSDQIEEILTPMIPMLEAILSKQEELDEFLKDRLGSKWKKLKRDWNKYQNNEISKGELILSGFKTLGRGFLKVFSSLLPS